MPLFDSKDQSRYSTFTRRTLMVSGAMTAIFGVLGGRLYQLEVLEGDEFKTKSEENRISERLVAPPRGRILDRFGVELANNRRNFRVLLIPEQVPDGVKSAVEELGRIIYLSDRQRERVLREANQNKPFVPIIVAENLPWEDFARVNLHLPYLAGVQPDVGQTRAYPFGDELTHILGYVAAVSPTDQESDPDPLLQLPGFRIGKRGVEKKFETEVRGKAGVSRVEVNAYGRVVRELSREAGEPGADVYLTIDQNLQNFVAQRLGQDSAAAVVMDVATGDVMALASTPSFDPNLFNVGVSNTQWKAWTSDDHTPLVNKAIAGLYPPGSTIKPTMALAAYDAGLKDMQVFCSGSIALGNHVFHCWRKQGHGHVDLTRAIEVSCDVFFYECARRLGIDRVEAAAHHVGLGAQTGIELPGEKAGVVPGREWKMKRYHVPWLEGETLNTGIGQGYLLATPLQLCTVAARIASGNAVVPRLTRVVGRQAQPRPELTPLPFSDGALALVRNGMNGVTNTPGGTAFGFRISEPGYEMAGKTGTAQVRVISREEHNAGVKKNLTLPWKMRDHGLFISFAPVEKPRYACACITEHASDGHPQVLAARDILLYAQKRDPLKLPTAYPLSAASATRVGRRA
ncbi:MAG TPA: penicillin-binding protein 2 [Rhizomicrobium sp.]|jgi:penicillin-binding protein 2|nr:penicillin-binding protein 2 [Rhizomicrobium sp.]